MCTYGCVIFGVLAIILVAVRADLPVHCLRNQVEGDWVFYVDDGGKDNSISCGHSMPDRDDDHKDHEVRLSNSSNKKSFSLSLKEPSTVVGGHGAKGHWTMVYDEGFEVVINGYKYFAFSHYHSNPNPGVGEDPASTSNNINDCDRTFVGWYHAINGSDWGCYYGVKQGAVPLAEAPLAPRKQKSKEEWARDLDADVTTTTIHTAQSSSQPSDMASFLELINNSQSSFRVKHHSHLHNRTMDEIRQLAGGNMFIQTHIRTKPTSGGNFNMSQLPKSVDWRDKDGVNYDSKFRYQGFCGSCYSMATVQMLETRLNIATHNKHKFTLSTQHAVSCSRYNQGCDGGYPFLVSKFGQDFGGIVTEECFPYSPGSTCDQMCKNPSVKVSVSEYYYVGGYYGGCSEASMMQELHDNGPFVVSFNAGSDFMFYSGGVYSSTQYGDSFLELGEEPKLRVWEKTTHSVLLVGYGEDSREGKYWIAKNTWGEQWGEHGYFRIKRGSDESAFESMALAAKPVLEHLSSDSLESSDSSSPPQQPQVAAEFASGGNEGNQWNDPTLLQENEGEPENIQVGNPQVKALEDELRSFNDPAFEKDYSPLKRPRVFKQQQQQQQHRHQEQQQEQQQQQQQQQEQPPQQHEQQGESDQNDDEQDNNKHHHHHHHHHNHNHNHQHKHKHTSTDLENLIQVGEGENEFLDPADS